MADRGAGRSIQHVVPGTIRWGIREGIAASLWPLLGLEPTIGFATTCSMG